MGKENGIGKIGTIITERVRKIVIGHTKQDEADVIRILKHPGKLTPEDIEEYHAETVRICMFLVLMNQIEGALKFVEISASNPYGGIIRNAERKAKDWRLNLTA